MERVGVVHVLATLTPGGAERLATELSCRVDPDRFRSAAVLLYPPGDGPLERRLAEAHVPVETAGKGRLGFDPRVPGRLFGALRRLRPDVVHTHGYPLGYVLPALLALRVPAVHTLHTLAEHETRPGPSRTLHRLAFRAGVTPVCISDAVAASLHATYGVEGLVIRNGVDLDRFAAPTVPRAAWRAAHGLADGDRVVACVARVQAEKEPLLLLDAFARVAARDPATRLVWVGDGPQRPEVAEAIGRSGLGDRVLLLGTREDVPDVLHAADVFALASRYEGLGLAVVEAHAAGLPVVATRVGGVPEVVADGESGLLVPRGDAAALADALSSLLADAPRRAAMAARARERAGAFDLRAMIRAYEDLYARVGGPR